MKIINVFFIGCLLAFSSTSLVAQSSNVLLEDDFDENALGWDLGDDNFATRKIEGGHLILECKKYQDNHGGFWMVVPDFKIPIANFSISMTTRWIKNLQSAEEYYPYGFIIGDYYFLIYADGHRRMLKYNPIEKSYDVVVDWGKHGAINQRDSGDNILEIQIVDGQAALYVNGQMLFKKEVNLIPGDKLKLYIENSEVVSFDDLKITTL